MEEAANSNDHEISRRIGRLAYLGALAVVPRGTTVAVEETNDIFFSVGAMRSKIAEALGWMQSNVWLHERDRAYIMATKRVFPDLFTAIAELLANPLSMHGDRRSPHAAYFLITRGALQPFGMVTNNPNKLVDGVIKWIETPEGSYLRLTHFSPVYQNQGLAQLWP